MMETAYWRMRPPTVAARNERICVATVHPIGDRRVVRCAQAALDAGYGIHYVWLGGDPGHESHSVWVEETRLPDVQSTGERIAATVAVTRAAWKSNADILHIHDFYLLPFAVLWALVHRRTVVYDVHEHYPDYYASKGVLPKWSRRVLRRLIEVFECWAARRLGAANVVNEALSQRFAEAGVKVATTPNLPAIEYFPAGRQLRADMLKRVLHTGSLTIEYGARVLLDTADILTRKAPDVRLTIIWNFPSVAAEAAFKSLLDERGRPKNIDFIEPVASHQIGAILETHGIGLSAIQAGGQRAMAVPTKLFEYIAVGLAIVSSDLLASRKFVEAEGVGIMASADNPEHFVDAIVSIIENAESVCERVNEASIRAALTMSWDRTCAPRLQSLLQRVSTAAGRR
jgi:glycosyltransferase involved in cell wall biosynthesis